MIKIGDEAVNPNVIHFLRSVQNHHVVLSSMADQKANILIGVNSVIFALVVREAHVMTVPMLVLAAASSLAAVLCMLAVVPAIGARRRTPAQGPPPIPNLLFFGAFTQIPEAEFQEKMEVIMSTDANIRHAMTRDIYQLGTVLQTKKYRYLGWAYRVFMVGLILTFIAFAVQELFF